MKELSTKDIVDDEEEIRHQKINYEVEILENNNIKEIKENMLKNDCKEMNVSKQDETIVGLEMNQQQNIHPSLFTMSNETMKEILKKIIKNHKITVQQEESVESLQPVKTQPLNPIQQLIKDRINIWIDDKALCKPQEYQQSNVNEHKNEMKNKQDQVKQKLHKTGEILSKMSKEDIKESLKRIIKKHQIVKSTTVQHQSMTSSQQICQQINHSIHENVLVRKK